MKKYLHWAGGLLVLCQLFMACKAQPQGEQQKANRLIHSSSPYLLQHAHNPVDWYPWGEEALQKAQKENKLLIISIGYAACHWCHVMEHESFEDSLVAAKMNAQYVSVKVDREERPDVDQVYMNAAYLTSGRGGWPLNAIALPDGRPIFAATYFPKKDWLRVIDHFANYYQTNPEKLVEAAEQVTQGIHSMRFAELSDEHTLFKAEDLKLSVDKLLAEIDFQKGGLKRTPKFPMPAVFQFLLRDHYYEGRAKALEAVQLTLDQMARGGIYDHVGGGFARYSTDGAWKVPHFEKMLYDNAQLTSLYAEAYRQTKNPRYRQVVYETLAFVEREMSSPEGGFYSSLDADSEGIEGKFYVWSLEEIRELLGEDAPLFMAWFNVSEKGNWEHGNILHITKEEEEICREFGLSKAEFEEKIAQSKAILLQARNKRIRPGLDDKVLTSWNALMLKGYVDAYRAFGEQKFLEVARKNAAFLIQNMKQPDQHLNRSYKDGKSTVNGFLDDYAFLIEAFVNLYQATFEEKWLFEADELMQYVLEHFSDEETQLFFYSSKHHDPLISTPVEISDNVIPASNSAMAKDLIYLGTYLYKDDYLQRAEKMTQKVLGNIREQPGYYANWAMVLTHFLYPPYEVAIVGEKASRIRQQFDQYFLPDAFFLGGRQEGRLQLLANKAVEGKTMIYVCQNKACKLPQTEVPAALAMMKRSGK
ncbi:MAG: thioredoxin domain-containing protein [Bacteroidetes bacterium]|nr:MAG: thioredoxin domain-containing protein [Bacteroidota bacterium]